MPSSRGKPPCPKCGGSLGFVERTACVTANGHHNHVYSCSNCDRKVVSG